MTWFTKNSNRSVSQAVPVMSLIGTQIQGVRKRVETAVIETCELFHAMGANAREMIKLTIGGGTGESRSDEIIGNARMEIQELLNNLKDGCDIANEISEQMAKLQGDLDQVNGTLQKVEKISKRARIVALNGQMEAIKAGDAGKAFAEVANQARDLASNVDSLSQDIRSSLLSFNTSLESVATKTNQYSIESRQRLEQRTESANTLLNELEENQHRLEANLSQATGLGQQLSADIGRAVSLLQFQDEVSQRLEHVIFASESVHELILGQSEYTDESQIPKQNSLLELIEQKYTMDSERDIQRGEEVQEAFADECQVELF